MKTQIRKKVIRFAKKRVEIEGLGHPELAALKTGKVDFCDTTYTHFDVFLEKEAEKGYDENDMIVKPYISTHSVWYSWLNVTITNIHTGASIDGWERLIFPKRKTYQKDFFLPELEKEKAEIEKRRAEKLEKSLTYYKEENIELKVLIEDLKLKLEIEENIEK